MMFLPSIIIGCGCASICALYNDYINREKFNNEFMPTCQIGDCKLMSGKISNNDNEDPMFELDLYKKQNYVDCYFHHYEGKCIHISEYWSTKNILSYVASNIKINDIDTILNPDCKIIHTKNNNYYISQNEIINEKSIPNNSIITIFGCNKLISVPINNGGVSVNKLMVKYIGSRQDVLDAIAYDYYGVSDGMTVLLAGSFILSVFSIFVLIKK
jgi:hypothetical protein